MMARKNDPTLLLGQTFKPYLPGKGPIFTLLLWDTHAVDEYRKRVIAYELVMVEPRSRGGIVTLFEGSDFHCPGSRDDRGMIDDIMCFLTTEPEEIEATSAQVDFYKHHAEALSCEVSALFGSDE